MQKLKSLAITIGSVLFSWLGILALPVALLVVGNIADYITGILASQYRDDPVSSYKSIKGIYKKVGMWILIFIGWMMDMLISFTVQHTGIHISLPFIVATVVAVWLICNEIISILENLIDMDVKIPPFLMPMAKMIKRQVEDKTKVE
ncbi:MAG: phage holin family protein [Hungatella sp.]|jgi:toxin secretion/phage lysis holin|nr:phage holin family protein [Hungatella sp.]